MALTIDKNSACKSFSNAANTYDERAVMQHNVADKMLSQLEELNIAPETILDVGCGTGRAVEEITRRYPNAKIIASDFAQPMLDFTKDRLLKKDLAVPELLCEDMDQLTIDDNSIDLIFTTSAIQWSADINLLFKKFFRALRPNGYIIFSTFGPETMWQLRESWSRVDGYKHIHHFTEVSGYETALLNGGFTEVTISNEEQIVNYHTLKDLMKDLKKVGVVNANSERARGMLGKTAFTQLSNEYEIYRIDDCLPLSYDVIFGHARKP